MKPELSVVIPALDAARTIGATVEALAVAVARAGLATEVILVDDGSTDGTADAFLRAASEHLAPRVIRQPNRGRFEARRVGIAEARGRLVLLLDSRVAIDPGALEFAVSRFGPSSRVWTSHVRVDAHGSPLGVFWSLIAELAWSAYFDDPRTVGFDATDFDRYPKGTTCFLAPRELLLDAIAAFESRYADSRHANDDTPLIRWMAEREPIHVSPAFACDYAPRTTLRAFVRASVHRGVVFVDGHGRHESRFFPAVVAFYPGSLLAAVVVGRRPIRALGVVAGVAVAAVALGVSKRRTPAELRVLGLVTPLYAAAHGAGMWKALGLVARAWVAARRG